MLVCSLGVAQLGRGVIYFDPPPSTLLNLEFFEKTYYEKKILIYYLIHTLFDNISFVLFILDPKAVIK